MNIYIYISSKLYMNDKELLKIIFPNIIFFCNEIY